MNETRTIELDAATATALETHAAARGVSVSEAVAQLVALDGALAPNADEIVQLDRQWAAIQAGEPTMPHEQVARWLETWGTPAFKPWHER
jgi:predicted transcriptional regulator